MVVQDIEQFLVQSYGDSTTAVVIFEAQEPYYIIASSTQSPASTSVLTSDPSKPCPVTVGINVPCTPVRISVGNLSGHSMDSVLVSAFERQEQAGYPQELVIVETGTGLNDPIYISQSTLFVPELGANLQWRVIIVSPGGKSTSDAVTRTDNFTLFVGICMIGGVGFAICLGFFLYFYGKRKERAVIHADWRFTCAFIVGCSLLNLSSYALLGNNTDTTCLARMWTFHMLFVVALSPLFVKVWRLKQLVGSPSIRRVSISNARAAMYTLPVVMIQLGLLFIITFVDPPKQDEVIEESGGVVVQHTICATNTKLLLIVEASFESALVVIGCILAYQTRNVDRKFGEAKQLIFAMYNIALVGIIIVVVMTFGQLTNAVSTFLQAVGVFWGSVVSSAAFVLPRMLEIRHEVRMGPRRRVRLSGLDSTGLATMPLPSGVLASIMESTTQSELDSVALQECRLDATELSSNNDNVASSDCTSHQSDVEQPMSTSVESNMDSTGDNDMLPLNRASSPGLKLLLDDSPEVNGEDGHPELPGVDGNTEMSATDDIAESSAVNSNHELNEVNVSADDEEVDAYPDLDGNASLSSSSARGRKRMIESTFGGGATKD